MSLEKKVAQLLIQRGKTLSVAESCTGGLLCDRLTNIPGSSHFFKCGIIAYSNESKKEFLHVPSQFLMKYGAVSPEVVRRMADSVRKIFKTDFGIGITGIAGPTGKTPQKPVGLTFIAISAKEKNICKKFIFKGNRLAIKSQAVNEALKTLLNLIDVTKNS